MSNRGITYGILGLIIGLIIGFFGANYLNRNAINQSGSTPVSSVALPQRDGNPETPLADVQITLDKAKNEPENFEAQLKAGEIHARIQRFEKAIEYYNTAEKLNPGNFESNVKLGNAFFDAKQFEKAGAFYANAIKLNPKDINVRTDYGLTFYLRVPSDPARAISEYQKSLEIDPNHELTLQNLAAALKDKGDEDELAKILAKLKEINPNNPAISKLRDSNKL